MKTEEEVRQRFRRMDDDQKGLAAERIWRRIFERSGIYYTPLTDICEGGAPLVRGPTNEISPDFNCFARKWRAFIDSKFKTTSIVFRVAGFDERHGIDKKNYAAYSRVSQKARQKAGLGIVELWRGDVWSGALLIQALAKLGPPALGINSQKHMVYWSRGKFVALCQMSAVELDDLIHGRKPAPNMEQQLEDVFHFGQDFQGSLWS